MTKYGLSAKSINAVTKAEAEKEGINIWNIAEEKINVILVSPEMLTTPGFGYLITSSKFRRRLCAIGVDEVHLLDSWGESFRPAFRQIAYIQARFPTHVVMFSMTATLHIGRHTESVCKFLGYQNGNFTLLRRSNARPDIQLLIREWNTTRSSSSYPKLDWILKESGKILIFCPTIRYGFNLAVYIWHLDPRNAVLTQNIRMFNSLNSPDYNRETLELLEGNTNSKITIATDKLSVGVDISDFQTVVIIEPKDLDDLCQKAGRVGRDKTKIKDPKVVVFIPTQTMRDAKAFVETLKSNATMIEATNNTGGTRKRKRKGTQVDEEGVKDGCGGLYETIMAPCHVAEINRQYGNPTTDTQCSEACQSCSLESSVPLPTTPPMCNCSGCIPEKFPTAVVKQPRKPTIPLRIRVTQDMRKAGKARIHQYRELLWASADERSTGLIPIESYFPDTLIDKIFDAFPTVLSKSTLAEMIEVTNGKVTNLSMATQLLKPFIRSNPALGIRSDELVELLWLIHAEFDQIRDDKKKEARAKREAKKQSQDQNVENEKEVQSSESEEEQAGMD